MGLSESNNDMVMPVAPMYGYGNSNNGFGFGGDGAWLILFILLACGGGWGNGFGGFGGFNGGLGYDFPWLLNGQQGITSAVTNGFDNAAINSQLSGIQNAITTGFSNAEVSGCNRAMDAMQTAYTNQISDLERSYASQTANTQGLTNLSSQLAQSCSDNRLATCQTQNIIQNEGNQTRFADLNNTRDIIQNQTNGIQAILDKLCQLELDAKDDKINDLERQLTMANLAASQTAQNAFIAQGLNDEVDQLYNRLSNCPVPTTPVYGRTPIFTCNNNGCGCGQF